MPTPSARWNENKGVWWCAVSGRGGGAVDLATRLGVTVPGRVAKPSLETFAGSVVWPGRRPRIVGGHRNRPRG